MKILDKNGLSGLMEKLIWIIFFAECAAVIFLPWILEFLIYFSGKIAPPISNDYYYQLLILMYFTFLLGIPFTWQIKGILKNINNKKPFIEDNVQRLKLLSIFSVLLAVGYFVGFFFVPSFFVPLMFLLFMLMGLFLKVCSELFLQAVKYKEENELTV